MASHGRNVCKSATDSPHATLSRSRPLSQGCLTGLTVSSHDAGTVRAKEIAPWRLPISCMERKVGMMLPHMSCLGTPASPTDDDNARPSAGGKWSIDKSMLLWPQETVVTSGNNACSYTPSLVETRKLLSFCLFKRLRRPTLRDHHRT